MIALLLMAYAIGSETLVLGADPQRVTLGNANVMTQMICPKDSRHVIVRCETNACKYVWTGTDGGTIDATDYGVIPADTYWTRRLPGAQWGPREVSAATSIYIASATASTVVQIECTREGE